jgi:hypothetical protein
MKKSEFTAVEYRGDYQIENQSGWGKTYPDKESAVIAACAAFDAGKSVNTDDNYYVAIQNVEGYDETDNDAGLYAVVTESGVLTGEKMWAFLAQFDIFE